MSSPGPLTVDNTNPEIQYSPPDIWKLNEICGACNVSNSNKDTLQQQAFNSTWHGAPGAQIRTRDMSIDFDFVGSRVIAMLILFRRTDTRGQTRDDGKSNIFVTLDGDRRSSQRLALTLDGWTDEELKQQFRFQPFFIDSPIEGNHSLKIQFLRENAMEVPVTFGLDYIRFTPPSTIREESSTLIATSTSETSQTLIDTATPTITLAATTRSTPGNGVEVGKIVGPVAGLVLALVALVTLLLCWRQRRIRKHRRIKAAIRPSKPIPFEPYHQQTPYSFYRSESPVHVEKPPPTRSTQRPYNVPIGSWSLDLETLSEESTSPSRLANTPFLRRLSSLTFSSFSAPRRPRSDASYDEQWRYVASNEPKPPLISTTPRNVLPIAPKSGHTPFVVVNK